MRLYTYVRVAAAVGCCLIASVARGQGADSCVNAEWIQSGSAQISTIDATTDGPTPQPECNPSFPNFLNDVWYRYMPATSGTLTVSTCGTANFDTKIAVYTGACGSLSILGCAEDTPGCANFTSTVSVEAVTGVPLYIRVGGYFSTVRGTGTLTITGPAPTPAAACCLSSVTCVVVPQSLCTGTYNSASSACTTDLCAPPLTTLVSQIRGVTAGAVSGLPFCCFTCSGTRQSFFASDFGPFNQTANAACGPNSATATHTSTVSPKRFTFVGSSSGSGSAAMSSATYQVVFDVLAPAQFSMTGRQFPGPSPFGNDLGKWSLTGPGTNVTSPGSTMGSVGTVNGVLDVGRYTLEGTTSAFGVGGQCEIDLVLTAALLDRACCLNNGQCTFTTAANCTGTPGPVQSTCTPTICPSAGACCSSAGACTFIVQSLCNGLYQGDNTTCNVEDCVGVQGYEELKAALRKTEIVRTWYLASPRPRVYAVLAALRRVAARNPSMTEAQLTAFALAYHDMLGNHFPGDPVSTAGDPDLYKSFNLAVAVRFPKADISPALPGIDTEIGADVVFDLGIDPTGSHPSVPYLPRQQQMARFELTPIRSLASSGKVATILRTLFQGRAADGRFNAGLVPAATAYLLDPTRVGLDINPSPAQLQTLYPNVVEAIALLPTSYVTYKADELTGFLNLRSTAWTEISTVRGFINTKLSSLSATLAQFPTVQSSVNRSEFDVQNALNARASDEAILNRSRSKLTFVTEAMVSSVLAQPQVTVQLKEYSAVQLQVADSALSTAGTAVQGLGQIGFGAAAIFAKKGLNTPEGITAIIGGVGILLPLFGLEQQNMVPNPDQMILDEIAQVRNQINTFQTQMNDRFNRVDALLIGTYTQVNAGFASMNTQLVNNTAQLNSLRQTLADVASDMSRFEVNLYGILTNGFNINFVDTMNSSLGFQKGNNSKSNMPYDIGSPAFVTSENILFGYATNSGNSIYAQQTQLPYTLAGATLLSSGAQPFGYYINGLRQVGSLPALDSAPIANPTSWAISAEAYAQLLAENPWYARTRTPPRLQAVRDVGVLTQATVSKALAPSRITQLRNDYTTRRTSLLNAINAAAPSFLINGGLPDIDPSPAIFTAPVDLWMGDVTQMPVGGVPEIYLNGANAPYASVPPITAKGQPGTRGRMTFAGQRPLQPQQFNNNVASGSGATAGWDASIQGSQDAPFFGDLRELMQRMPGFLPGQYFTAHYLTAFTRLPAEFQSHNLRNFAWTMDLRFPSLGDTWPSLNVHAPCNIFDDFGVNSGNGGAVLLVRSVTNGALPVAISPASRPTAPDVTWVPSLNADPYYVIRRRNFDMVTNSGLGCQERDWTWTGPLGDSSVARPRRAFAQKMSPVWNVNDAGACQGRQPICLAFDQPNSGWFTQTICNSGTGQYSWTNSPGTNDPSGQFPNGYWDTIATTAAKTMLARAQAWFYDDIAAAIRGTDTWTGNSNYSSEYQSRLSAVRTAADNLEVSARFLDAYVSLGCPQALAQSDVLRSGLRGTEMRFDRSGLAKRIEDRAAAFRASTSPMPDTSAQLAAVVSEPFDIFFGQLQSVVGRGNDSTPYFESYPFMEWSLASMNHLVRTYQRVAADDQYLAPTGAPLTVPAASGVLANDPRGPAPTGRLSAVRVVLPITQPAAGTGIVVMQEDGGFTYTPPSPGFTGVATFTYQAEAALNGRSETPVPNDPNWVGAPQSASRTVRIIVGDCAPTITTQPIARPFIANGTVSFRVLATGTGGLTYQWLRNGVALSDGTTVSDSNIVGATSPILTISSTKPADRARYSCRVSSSCSSATSAGAYFGCVADFDGNGTYNLDDLFIFISSWFQSDPRCDVDSNGATNLDDIFIFINIWFAGC